MSRIADERVNWLYACDDPLKRASHGIGVAQIAVGAPQADNVVARATELRQKRLTQDAACAHHHDRARVHSKPSSRPTSTAIPAQPPKKAKVRATGMPAV